MIMLASDHLRCGVARATTCCLQGLPGAISIGQTKVDYFDVVVVIHEQVLWLQITMADTKLVKILNT